MSLTKLTPADFDLEREMQRKIRVEYDPHPLTRFPQASGNRVDHDPKFFTEYQRLPLPKEGKFVPIRGLKTPADLSEQRAETLAASKYVASLPDHGEPSEDDAPKPAEKGAQRKKKAGSG